MKRAPRIDRRRFLAGMARAAALLALAGCDNLSQSNWFPAFLGRAEKMTYWAQRRLTARTAMAREYSEADISAQFPANGEQDPDNPDYRAHAENGFAGWKLEVGGLVERPAALSLDELWSLPSRTQITRHDCVEGWSAIAKWTGVPLHEVLARVRPLPAAQYVVFHCADADEGRTPYYESLDLEDAHHPQTILAYGMNGDRLPIEHGAPIRLRVERQLGYKHAKYVMRIELVSSLGGIGGGRGGYWEDQGYEWYAGI
jgi:DMSO/TMAO reductase YedYZ molybdopterin-dependent catalytic subunit